MYIFPCFLRPSEVWGEQFVQRLGLIVIHQHLAGSIAGENWWNDFGGEKTSIKSTLLGTNISLEKSILKMMFLFPRWDMLISWRVAICRFVYYLMDSGCWNLWWNSPIFSHFHVEIHTHSWQNRPVARVTFFFTSQFLRQRPADPAVLCWYS